MRSGNTAHRAITALAGGLAAIVTFPAIAADVTQTRLENADAEPQNWLMGYQNYSSHRHSRLTQINRDNVRNLKVAMTIPLTTGLLGRTSVNLQNYPLIDDGFMYVDDGGGTFYKIDVTKGTRAQFLWKADAALAKDIGGGRSRGITMMGKAIYHNLPDGRVVAINRDTGEFLWDKQIARVAHPKSSGVNIEKEGFTAAPIATEGRIIVGNSSGDAGTRGWVAAINATTGAEQWRTYMIPGPGEPGFETWKDQNGAWKTGGAGMWTTGSYDPGQKLTIWGTAQPVPMFDPEFRPGDNLYTNSAVALELETGKMKWYFQYTPNESWDYDEQGVHMLIDATYNGQAKKLVTHFGRNGFYYQLDRTNGAFVSATQFVDKVNWTAGIDPKTGKPVEYNPNVALQTYVPETRFLRGEKNNPPACPHLAGGVRWQPPSYNATKHIAYAASVDGCFTLDVITVTALPNQGGADAAGPGGLFGAVFGANTTVKNIDQHGLISAVDVTTGKVVARLRQTYNNLAGVLSTQGGLVFTGNVDGSVTAHNDDTLAELWRFDTNISIKAAPVSYAIGDRQYIAIVAGGPPPGGGVYPELGQMIAGAMLYVFTL